MKSIILFSQVSGLSSNLIKNLLNLFQILWYVSLVKFLQHCVFSLSTMCSISIVEMVDVDDLSLLGFFLLPKILCKQRQVGILGS